jgi:uncharacterized membrane protein YeaQ/YmgE (transglycosylase-associated protein family)
VTKRDPHKGRENCDAPGLRYYVRVFPVSPVVVAVFLVVYSLVGMAIGALTGWLASLVTKSGPKWILNDALLGSIGFLAAFIGCMFIPWPSNTVVEQLEGGGTVATTMSRYQHPERVAIVMAVLLPLLHEVYRFARAHTDATREN